MLIVNAINHLTSRVASNLTTSVRCPLTIRSMVWDLDSMGSGQYGLIESNIKIDLSDLTVLTLIYYTLSSERTLRVPIKFWFF